MNHIAELFSYIYHAPEDIQKKYCNGWEIGSDEWVANDTTEASFKGIIFRDNKVFIYNIFVHFAYDDYMPKYLEITNTFNKLSKTYSAYHLCILLQAVLKKKYYRDSSLAEKLRLLVLYDTPQQLPKFRYQLQRHHSRHRKFYHHSEHECRQVWDKIIRKALHEVDNLEAFRRNVEERFPTLFTDYRCEPRFRTDKNEPPKSDDLREKKPRKLRRCFYSDGFERGDGDR